MLEAVNLSLQALSTVQQAAVWASVRRPLGALSKEGPQQEDILTSSKCRPDCTEGYLDTLTLGGQEL